MPGAAKEATRKKLHLEDDERTSESLKRELKPQNKGHSSKSRSKARELKPQTKVLSSFSKCTSKISGKDDGNVIFKRRKVVKKTVVNRSKTSKKQPSLGGLKDKSTNVSSKASEKADDRDVISQKSKRRRTKRKNNVELDEASRLQRRTRYLLIKVKLEQNLIDAYSTEGWKGQSREKIRPEKELRRAEKQILKCKLGIREAIHQLDLLSSEGRINDSAVAPDGSMHHEHIICAKCKLREALPDNDIILCDGTCNRAFHQECMDPPMSTENIPPGDEGWFCKFCKKKTEILEATNAHLGTHFPLDSNWQDLFKEEAALPDGGNSVLLKEEAWPSDDSEDDDYDPDRNECSCSANISTSESDASQYSSSFLGSLEDEDGRFEVRSNRSFDETLQLIGVDSDEINNGEVVSHPRQRAAVDYIKLYNEMFGKNATESEQISEDEDWGPTKRKRKAKETNAASSTLMTLSETDKKISVETRSDLKAKQLTEKMKRPIFRLPHDAVEKLRLVFAENELPERALRVSLSKQLGLEFEKVNKWFKNARYLALKERKQTEKAPDAADPGIQKESSSDTEGVWDQISSRNNTASANCKISKKFLQRRNTHLLNHSYKRKQPLKPLLQSAGRNQMGMDLGDDVSLKHLRDKAKEAKKKSNCKSGGGMLEAETEMKRLCEIKSRVERLQQLLLELPSSRFGKSGGNNSGDMSVLFVPVAELREKR